MSATIPQAAQTPRTTPALTERARMVRCGVCWAEPGDPCGDARGDLPGLHLGRFARARRKGLLTAAEAAAVIEAAGPVFTSATVTGDGAQPACTGYDADGVPLHTGDRVHVESHRTTGDGRSVLLSRQHAAALRDWLGIAEGWDGVPRRCPAAHTPGDRWLFECDQPPGHPGPHEGLAARWPAGQVRERMCWS